MRNELRIDDRDAELIQIVDAAVAEAARKSGPWLVCRLGCTQCCIGAFPISQLDAERLRRGLAEIETQDPDRARRVRERPRPALAPDSARFSAGPSPWAPAVAAWGHQEKL